MSGRILDLGQLKKDLGPVLTDALSDVLEGSRSDLEKFGQGIAQDLLSISTVLDQKWSEERTAQLLDQMKVLAEINRIRAEAAAWRMAEKIITAVLRAAIAGALAAI